MIRNVTAKDLAEFGVESSAGKVNNSATSNSSSGHSIKADSNVSSGCKEEKAPSQDSTNIDNPKDDSTPLASSYPGDADRDLNEPPLKDSEYKKLDFESPAELICFFNEHINKGQVTLHLWQVDISDELACIGGRTTGKKPTQFDPLKLCICAANGSGKDAFVVAPFAVWFILTKIRSRVIVTSSSGTQLTGQTEKYIADLAHAINAYYNEPIFKIKQRYIKCLLSGSEIRMFATDEAGKAEGYHPLDPGAEMAIVINEAKSVDEEIFKALTRCTGYNYWMEVSTPGEPAGHFYFSFTNWKLTRHVTAFDCPHLGIQYIEDAKLEYGEHSALYRSMVLALFTSLGGQVVISKELLNKCLGSQIKPICQEWPLRIGIDISLGGAETSITSVRGNKIVERYDFRLIDAVDVANAIDKWLTSKGISKEHEHIYADDGGVGRAVIDILVRMDWHINRVLNQHPAINKRDFGNRGAEGWFRLNRLVEERIFDFRDAKGQLDQKLIDQLTVRHYKQPSSGRIFLEAKKDEIANGHPSPDRADSLVLALTGLDITHYLKSQDDKAPQSKTRILTAEEVIEYMEEERFKAFQQIQQGKGHVDDWSGYNFEKERQHTNQTSNRYCSGSLDCALNTN